jgi:Fur family peroxide stress response transcriptional regulator
MDRIISREECRQRLTDSGLKATHQRLIIFEALVNTTAHPTAEKMFEWLRAANPTLSLGTVYRTLETFVEVGLAQKVSSPSGVMMFDGNVDDHHHLICNETQQIFDLHDPKLTALVHGYLREHGPADFEIQNFQLLIHGAQRNA